MSCWATARANVELDQDQGVKLLSDAEVAALAKTLLEKVVKGESVYVQTYGGSQTYIQAGGYTIRIWQGAGRQIDVMYTNQSNTVAENQQKADAMREALTAILQKMGGLKLQAKVAAAFKGMAQVENEAKSPNGAIVLTLNF